MSFHTGGSSSALVRPPACRRVAGSRSVHTARGGGDDPPFGFQPAPVISLFISSPIPPLSANHESISTHAAAVFQPALRHRHPDRILVYCVLLFFQPVLMAMGWGCRFPVSRFNHVSYRGMGTWEAAQANGSRDAPFLFMVGASIPCIRQIPPPRQRRPQSGLSPPPHAAGPPAGWCCRRNDSQGSLRIDADHHLHPTHPLRRAQAVSLAAMSFCCLLHLQHQGQICRPIPPRLLSIHGSYAICGRLYPRRLIRIYGRCVVIGDRRGDHAWCGTNTPSA